MLYELLLNYVESFSFLNVFKYITFRTGLAFFTSLLITLLIGGPFIKFFSNRKIFNPIRDDGPSNHIIKKIGTPTMGGVVILFGLIASVLLWADLKNVYILFCLYIVVSFGILGAYDDYKKIRNISSEGISSKFKAGLVNLSGPKIKGPAFLEKTGSVIIVVLPNFIKNVA